MEYNVHFRFNKRTGQVEEFVIETIDDDLPEAEHNRAHDQRAADLARLVERNPQVAEAQPRPAEREAEPLESPKTEPIRARDAGKGST